MGFLNLFGNSAPRLSRLPHGTFSVDAGGRVLVGTVPSTVSPDSVQAIGDCVLQTFREAKEAQLPLSELIVHFGSLKIVARELRGGALIFLTPLDVITPSMPAQPVDL